MLESENIYLAEDRILCMGIHKAGKKMHYLPDAFSKVDPMKSLHTLMGQRRRWINGSTFAFGKVKEELSNSPTSQVTLSIQILYLSLCNMFSYFSPAILLFTVH
jgi:chitin synthase